MPDAPDLPEIDPQSSHSHPRPPIAPAPPHIPQPAIARRTLGHSSSCTCSRCTISATAPPGGAETRLTSRAEVQYGYPNPTAAIGPPNYAYPPLEPLWIPPPMALAAYRQHHGLDSTMSAASSHTSTEPSTNSNQPSAPPHSRRGASNLDNLPAWRDSYENNPFIRAHALQSQLTRAEVTASRFGNHPTPTSSDAGPRLSINPPNSISDTLVPMSALAPASRVNNSDNDHRAQEIARMPNLAANTLSREVAAQSQDQNPLSQPWNRIPTPDEMRAAQLRHHDAMLSDEDHARFGTGRRRPPPRDHPAHQRLANPRSRHHATAAAPGLSGLGNRHRRSPHLLEDLLYVDEDGDDENPDRLTAALLRSSTRSSDQRPSRQPALRQRRVGFPQALRIPSSTRHARSVNVTRDRKY